MNDGVTSIRLAASQIEIDRCFAVMKQLREKLRLEEFAKCVSQQQEEGYRIAFLESEAQIVAVAGFRILHMLASGKTLYVHLATDQSHRSKGFGETLLKWLANYARNSGCHMLSLDSSVQRRRAHRFYFLQGMHVSDFHFEMHL
jgi:GNAT superfamily N-acetyltransferase